MDKERVIGALSATGTLPKEITSEVEMLQVLNEGLPVATMKAIAAQGIIDDAELKTFIPARTLARRKAKLSPEESDLVARIARIHAFAVEVLGNQEKARKWLRTPNRALQNHRPLDLLRSDYGARIVESILGRIAHGIYS